MKALTMTILVTAVFATAGTAASAAPATPGQLDLPLTAGLEQVDSIPALTRLDSWSVIDDQTLIIWATPRKPYLVRLHRPSPELRFALTIGVTSFGSRIHARFDSVEVDGFSYPIREIYEMTRDDAKVLQASS